MLAYTPTDLPQAEGTSAQLAAHEWQNATRWEAHNVPNPSFGPSCCDAPEKPRGGSANGGVSGILATAARPPRFQPLAEMLSAQLDPNMSGQTAGASRSRGCDCGGARPAFNRCVT